VEEAVRLNFLADVPWKAFGWIGLSALLYSAVTFDFGDFWDWLNTFVATGLSVIAGVLLYRHQTDRAEKQREDQLLTALAGELGACLGMLRGRPTPILVPTGTKTDEEGNSIRTFAPVEEAVLAHLPAVAVQEALRSAVFDYEDSRLLSNIAGHIHVHNSEVSFVLSGRSTPVSESIHPPA
jgi:hypothetical protein